MVFANNVLQGNLDGAGNTVSRLLVNSITGFGGTVDVAADSGVPYVKEDSGQTLAVWGLAKAVLMIPILGPTNVRDGVGTLVDSFLDPLSTEVDKAAVDWPRRGADGIDTRADPMDVLDDLERTSLDYYASIRSLISVARTKSRTARATPLSRYQILASVMKMIKRPRDKNNEQNLLLALTTKRS